MGLLVIKRDFLSVVTDMSSLKGTIFIEKIVPLRQG